MNEFNINEKKNFNDIRKKNSNHNSLEIDLLDTIDNNKLLFGNVKNNNDIKLGFKNENNNNNFIKESDLSNDNFVLNLNEIIDENSDIIKDDEKNNENLQLENNIDEDNEISNEKKDENNNILDFNTFKEKKSNSKKYNNAKTSYSFSSNIYKQEKTYNIKKKIDKKDEDNNNESKKIKFKYNKERIEMNKKRINNLYEDYKKILNKRENKKKELSKEEMKDCSFNPKIDKNSKKLALNNPPIFLRDNKNNDKKKIIMKKYELNFTHIPKINKKFNLSLNNTNINHDKYFIKKINTMNNEGNKSNEKIKNINILKRQILLDQYINQQKINYIPNISKTFKSKISIKKNIIYAKKEYKNKSLENNKNLSFNKINNNHYKKNKNRNGAKILRSKSFLSDYLKDIKIRIPPNIINKKHINPIISIDKIDKYYKNNYNTNNVYQNNNCSENLIKNYINKINDNIYNNINDAKGICYNITENCMNIKKISFKNKRFNVYK